MGDAADDLEFWGEMEALDKRMGWDDDQGSKCPKCKGEGKVNRGDLFDCSLCDGQGEI